MKRILNLLRRDLLSTRKDFMLLYVVFAPLLLTLGLRLFLPAVGQASVQVVVTESMPPALAAELEEYLEVEVVPDRAALERRVLAYDEVVGIVPEPGADGGYTLVLEGNESHDSRELPRMVLHKLSSGSPLTFPMEVVSGEQVPLREVMGAFAALSIGFLAGMVMGFHIIEDRESAMLTALWVTPLSRREYVAARSLLTVTLSLFLTFASLWVLGVRGFDPLQLLAITLTNSLTAIIIGFVIGAVSGNQIAGIANVKFAVLGVLLPAILTLIIPERYQFFLYWLPPYWAFSALRAILEDRAGWATVGPMVAWNLATGLALLAVAYRWLQDKLAEAYR